MAPEDVGPPTRLDQLLESLIAAAEGEAPEDRRFIRYVTLADRYATARYRIERERPPQGAARDAAAEVCVASRPGHFCSYLNADATPVSATQGERMALSKLVNLLSRTPNLVRPAAVGEDTYRIDLRDYGWDAALNIAGQSYPDGWEAIASQAPNTYELRGELAERLKVLTGTPVPFLFLGSFLEAGTQGELYYSLVGLPDTLEALQRDLAGQAPESVTIQRAAFDTSGISYRPRVVERRVPANGVAYWQALDFATVQVATQIYTDPTGPITADSTHLIFKLANGLDGYFIADRSGRRITESPLEDPPQPDKKVHAISSCVGCHQDSVVQFEDKIRRAAERDGQYDSAQLDAIRSMYPRTLEMRGWIEEANESYAASLEQAGVASDETDPISALYYDLKSPLPVASAAGTLLVTPESLRAKLLTISPVLAPLAGPDGSVDRATFDIWYFDAMCVLYRGAKNLPASCP
jgi:hypothetical protein